VIGAILFDLYETLVTERDPTPTRAASLADVLGLDPTLYRPIWKRLRPRVVRGELSFAQALAHAATEAGVSVDCSVVERLCTHRLQEKAVVFQTISSEIATVIRRLHDRGIRLAVVSNGFAEDVAGWPTCVLSPSFDAAVFSCDVGIAKPHEGIYLEALQRLRVDACDALYIGDGGDDELTGAEQVGLRAMRATWFTGARVSAPGGRTWRALAACEDVLRLVTDDYGDADASFTT